MNEDRYLELVNWIERYEKREPVDRTAGGDETLKQCKELIRNAKVEIRRRKQVKQNCNI